MTRPLQLQKRRTFPPAVRPHLRDATATTPARAPRAEALERRRLLSGQVELLKDIDTTPLSRVTYPPVELGNALYYANADGVHGNELWKTDGTAGGTTLVKDVTAGPASSLITDLTVVGARIFFVRTSWGGIDSELWTSDGTAAGTQAVTDIIGRTLYYPTASGDLF